MAIIHPVSMNLKFIRFPFALFRNHARQQRYGEKRIVRRDVNEPEPISDTLFQFDRAGVSVTIEQDRRVVRRPPDADEHDPIPFRVE
jgi:hypothetical protein